MTRDGGTKAAAGGGASAGRFGIVIVLFSLVYLVLLAKAFFLQINEKQKLTSLGARQHKRDIVIVPHRGKIFDANGEELATSLDLESFFVNPGEIVDKHAAAAQIAAVIGDDPVEVERSFDSKKHFVWVKRRVTPEVSARLKALKIKGMDHTTEPIRLYPNKELLSNTLGIVGMDGKGLEGLESQYDSILQFQKVKYRLNADAKGTILYDNAEDVKDMSVQNSLFLTIDKNIQFVTEDALDKGVEKYQPKDAIAIAMDPATGRILAIASRPSFNPNNLNGVNYFDISNRAVSMSYEPGSTFKAILVSAAINEGVIGPNDKFYCEDGKFAIGKWTIKDHEPFGMLDVRSIIQKSSNIGAAKIGMKLGWQNLYKYVGLFGFGQKTGIDLPGEQRGIVKKKSRKSGVFVATMSFGQGVSVTPIQLITAISAIANGGKLMRPYILDHVIDKDGAEIIKNSPVEVCKVIEPSTARIMTDLMESVTQGDGTGVRASVAGFTVSGKTGTAQKVDPATHRYSRDHYISSFVGYVPSRNPVVAILVIFDEPKGQDYYGGAVAGPVFQEIAEKILGYLLIEPQNASSESIAKREMASAETDQGSLAQASFNSKVQHDKFNLVESDGYYTMPNFLGLDYMNVARIVNRKLMPVVRGSGYVLSQSPQPGFRVKKGGRIMLTLGEL